DAAILLKVIAGQDRNDPTTLGEAVPNYPAMLAERVANLTIGVDWDYVSRGVDEVVVDTVREALALFTELGAAGREGTMPPTTERLAHGWGVTCAVECARAHRRYYPARKREYGPVLAGLIEAGLSATEADYQAMERLRAQFTRELDALLEDVDVLIAPCMPMLPPPLALMESRVTDDD